MKDPSPIIEAVERGLVAEAKIDGSVSYLLTEMMKLGLFENPYLDPDKGLQIVNNPESQTKAAIAHKKSIVLLRNDAGLLPLTDDELSGVRLYVERFPGGENGELTAKLLEIIREHDPTMTLVERLEEAILAFIWILPKQHLSKREPTVETGPLTGIDQVERIMEIQRTVPTITAIDFSSPWLIQEFEPYAATFLATFGTREEALLDVIRGRYHPTGKLPITIPATKRGLEFD